ncbi:lysoplasmalogenase [Streptosporangium sp. NPDC003464]
MSRNLLTAFWACSALHLLSLVTGLTTVEWVSKALLMPLLAAWLLSRSGPRLVAAGLLASAAGDVALEIDGLFVAGMVCFAVAHVCYVTFFLRGGGGGGRRWAVLIGYGVLWLVLVAALWPRLGDLRIPVGVYSLILTATAVTSAWHGRRTGAGGALFLLSDGLIALGLAGIDLPLHGPLVMTTYIAAQYLLASGALRRQALRKERRPTPPRAVPGGTAAG